MRPDYFRRWANHKRTLTALTVTRKRCTYDRVLTARVNHRWERKTVVETRVAR